MVQKIILIVFAAFLSLGTEAQTLNDPIYFNFSNLPKTDFDRKNGNASVNFLEINATWSAIKIGKKIKIFNVAYYRNSAFEFSNTFPQSSSFPTTLHVRIIILFADDLDDF